MLGVKNKFVTYKVDKNRVDGMLDGTNKSLLNRNAKTVGMNDREDTHIVLFYSLLIES